MAQAKSPPKQKRPVPENVESIPDEITFGYLAAALNELYHVKYYNQRFYIWSCGYNKVGFRSLKVDKDVLGLGKQGYISIEKDELAKEIHDLYKDLAKKFKFDKDPKRADPKTSLINEVLHFLEREGLIIERKIDKNLIYVDNGILNLKELEVVEVSEDTFVPLRIPWPYIKGAESPTIDKFFDEITRREGDAKGDNEADILTLYEVPAYALEPAYYIKKLELIVGPRNSGKTTYLNLVRDFLGDDNTSSINLYDFNDMFSRPAIAKKLANIRDDIGYDRLTVHAMGIINELTGGAGKISFRRIRQNVIEIPKPTTKFIYGGNDIPSLNLSSTTALAFVDRNNLQFFPNQFPQNKKFPEILRRETSGLLNNILEGLRRLRKNEAYSTTLSGQDHDELIEIFEKNAIYDSRREDEEEEDFFTEIDRTRK